jgi:hypothetical protein
MGIKGMVEEQKVSDYRALTVKWNHDIGCLHRN